MGWKFDIKESVNFFTPDNTMLLKRTPYIVEIRTEVCISEIT